jgi:rhodanese-related sulfurtransferase
MSFAKTLTKTTLLLINGMIINTACGQMTYDEKLNSLYNRSVPLMQPETLKNKLGNHNVYVLDIRSDEEYEVSHLPDARKIDYQSFKVEEVSDIPKNAEVIVYCSVGYRSEKAGEMLLKSGYTNVHNIYGGIFQWKNLGMEVVNMNNEPTDSVHTYNKKWSKWLTKGIKIYD